MEPEANNSLSHQTGWSWRMLSRIVLAILAQQLAGWFSPRLRCFWRALPWPRRQNLGWCCQGLGRRPQQLSVLLRRSPTMPWVPVSLLQLWRQPMGLEKSQSSFLPAHGHRVWVRVASWRYRKLKKFDRLVFSRMTTNPIRKTPRTNVRYEERLLNLHVFQTKTKKRIS